MLIHLIVLFLLIMDPIGSAPLFATVLGRFGVRRQLKVILREMIFAFVIMVLTLFFAEQFFHLLGIDANSLSITGGIVLFLIGLDMIGSKPYKRLRKARKEPVLIPLAIPIIAGPSVLATIILYSGDTIDNSIVLGAIFIAWLISCAIVLLSPKIKKILGDNGAMAVEGIFGFIVILLAMEMILHGVLTTFV